VSWNGSGFDLPVLHYRGLMHGAVADHYWDMGEADRESKWNNYISRYHMRHLDLMDLLAKYMPRANAPLDAMAKLCGFPGKLGMDGGQVYTQYLDGQTEDIRRYCETDVMNTYLLYCRFQQMRGASPKPSTARKSPLCSKTCRRWHRKSRIGRNTCKPGFETGFWAARPRKQQRPQEGPLFFWSG